MFKNLSIQWKISVIFALLLMVCCIGLTVILNFSAYDMVNGVEMLPIDNNATLAYSELVPPVDADGTMTMSTMLPAAQMLEIKKTFSYKSVLAMLSVIFCGWALTYYFVGKELKPLKALNRQAKNMTVQNLSQELPVPDAKDELAELTVSFNEMTAKLNEAFLMQKHFSASAAHELRTPLAVLQTKIDVFRKLPSHKTEEYEALISVFDQQIKRLGRIVGHLLSMTNMDTEEEYDSVELADVLEDILSELAPAAKSRGISLNYERENCQITGNLDLIYRAFYNLIENGIKYNRENGSLTVTAKQLSEAHAEVEISDTGIGIPREMKKHIFEPFFRVDKSRSREMGGAGLGLAIADSVIKKYKGSIEILDNPEGGSCFKITL